MATSPFWTQNPFGFKVGARASQTQNTIVRFGLRWYLPTTGTWTQRDTLDAPLDRNNADRYAYAGDDPTNGSDPAGQAYLQLGGSACLIVCGDISIEHEAGRGWGFTIGGGAGASVGFSGSLGVQSGSISSGDSYDTSYGGAAGLGVQGGYSTPVDNTGYISGGGLAATAGVGVTATRYRNTTRYLGGS